MSETLERTPVLSRFMGRGGHFTLAWDAESDAEAERLITLKMQQGVVFRITGRSGPFRPGGGLVRLHRIADVPEDRRVHIDDADVRRFLEAGHGHVVDEVDAPKVEDSEVDEPPPIRRARTAREVMENDTIAHRPLAGG